MKSSKELAKELMQEKGVKKVLEAIDCNLYSKIFREEIMDLVFKIEYINEIFNIFFPEITKEELEKIVRERNEKKQISLKEEELQEYVVRALRVYMFLLAQAQVIERELEKMEKEELIKIAKTKKRKIMH
ncbi:MAG: hypothetical protein ACK4F9_07390 [Brevinematia bacterium]